MAVKLVTSTPQQAEALFKMNHAYHTNYAWQMNRKINREELMVQFNRVRLPRQMLVQPVLTEKDQISLNAKADMVMIAMKDDNPVGYVTLEENPSTKMVTITDLVVRQNERRNGIGSMLLVGAQDWTSHQGCQRIVVSMTTKNDPAISLFINSGFDYCGYQEFFSANHDIYLFYGAYLR